MEQIPGRERFPIMVFVALLTISRISSQIPVAHSEKHRLQDVYPGCRSSPDQPTTSYKTCDTSAVLQETTTVPSEPSEMTINITRFVECFRNGSKITVPSVETLKANFVWHITSKDEFCQEKCECEMTLIGAPETYFQISVDFASKELSALSVHIWDDWERMSVNLHEQKTVTTRHRNLTLIMDIKEGAIGILSFTFRFQAFPNCQRQLQVQCVSETRGMIETPGWSEGDKYLNNMDSCVTLHVPDNHVTMISLVSIDVELIRNKIDCADYLLMYTSGNCSGSNEEKTRICRAQDLAPTVIKGASVVSFLFKSNDIVVRTGFRLLFSFHEESKEPSLLPGGKWDCSVPYYDSFKQHFACVAESFCADKRDKVACPQADLCGSNLVEFGGSCYRMFEPLDSTTWTKASGTCSNYGGSLAILNTAFRLQKAEEFIQKSEVNKPVFVGLRIASSVTLREMYQSTWLWSDKTLAVYLPILYNHVDAPYCALLQDSRLTMVTCDQTLDAAYLCETDFTPDHAINDTEISLAAQSVWNMDNMTTCRHNHTTHTFLACDVSTNCSAGTQEETITCSNEFSPPVPLFSCRNQMEHVPYTLVCDFRSDCCDGSDEDFCDFPVCESRTEYECADGKQCIHHNHVCDKRSDCVDGSDEFKCRDSLTQEELRPNKIEPPARVDFTGDGNFNVTWLNGTSCPETHFQCPGEGYCLPVYVRCNKVNDCPGKEDEMDCDHYTCPGFYRCRKSRICLHSQHLCDGVFQCPQHDDEWMCNFTCPDTCHCYGHAFVCSVSFTAYSYPELRYVDAKSTGMKLESFLNNTKLIHINVRRCGITSLGYVNFPNLQVLDLSYNFIRELDSHIFQLKNLVSLSLAYNPIMVIDSFLYSDFQWSNIINLNLSGIMFPNWNDTLFSKFPNIKYLNMSGKGLVELTEMGFQSLEYLRVLDLGGHAMNAFFQDVFKGLNQLQIVHTANFKLCCPAVLPIQMDSKSCHAPKNEISSCDALLRADIFRVFLAIYAILALIGNAGSFVYRVCVERTAVKLGYEVFVTHLSVADFLMGVYLAIIGIADRIYLGDYLWNDSKWTHSVACKLAGFLSLVSSEVSAFLISLITLERLLVIGFPHKNLRFNRISAHAASMAVWLIGLVLALIPLLPFTSHWEFYSQSGICIPLPITRKEFDGSDYAFGVMIIMNFIIFLFIAAGQILIYWSIRVNTVGSGDNVRKSRDTAIARRLLAVVMTDFMCWFPIGLLGMMARSGVPISGEINVAIAIFVLPFNSALNPFLYTLNVVMERRRKIASAHKCQDGGETLSSQNRSKVFDVVSECKKEEGIYGKEEAFLLFKKFLEDGLLTPQQIRGQVWEIYEG